MSAPLHFDPGPVRPAVIRHTRLAEVQDARDARAECELVKVGTDTTPAEYDVVLYVHAGEPELDPRPRYVLESLAQALDAVQELIAPGDDEWVDPPLPTPEKWAAIVEAAFPPPPMAGA